MYIRSFEGHQQACSPYFHVAPHFNDSVFPYWCQIMYGIGILIFFKNQLNRSSLTDLHRYVEANGMYPSAIVASTGNFYSWHVQLLSDLHWKI